MLAPNVKGDISHNDDVTMICAEYAISLLGGLGQIAHWLKHGDEDDE